VKFNKLLTFISFTAILMIVGCREEKIEKPKVEYGISQHIENRSGRVSVWGVKIKLKDRTFLKTIQKKHIQIIESKGGQIISKLMDWRVVEKQKCLLISFKQGLGDFGTGNGVKVYLSKEAFKNDTSGSRYVWDINTDFKIEIPVK
jgi:hypothetical protein